MLKELYKNHLDKKGSSMASCSTFIFKSVVVFLNKTLFLNDLFKWVIQWLTQSLLFQSWINEWGFFFN